jgi:hypothetical protein
MATTSPPRPAHRAGERGIVARHTDGSWGRYHVIDCPQAPSRAQDDIRSVIRGPWRYLAKHWAPCPHCRPPRAEEENEAAAA